MLDSLFIKGCRENVSSWFLCNWPDVRHQLPFFWVAVCAGGRACVCVHGRKGERGMVWTFIQPSNLQAICPLR